MEKLYQAMLGYAAIYYWQGSMYWAMKNQLRRGWTNYKKSSNGMAMPWMLALNPFFGGKTGREIIIFKRKVRLVGKAKGLRLMKAYYHGNGITFSPCRRQARKSWSSGGLWNPSCWLRPSQRTWRASLMGECQGRPWLLVGSLIALDFLERNVSASSPLPCKSGKGREISHAAEREKKTANSACAADCPGEIFLLFPKAREAA